MWGFTGCPHSSRFGFRFQDGVRVLTSISFCSHGECHFACHSLVTHTTRASWTAGERKKVYLFRHEPLGKKMYLFPHEPRGKEIYLILHEPLGKEGVTMSSWTVGDKKKKNCFFMRNWLYYYFSFVKFLISYHIHSFYRSDLKKCAYYFSCLVLFYYFFFRFFVSREEKHGKKFPG